MTEDIIEDTESEPEELPDESITELEENDLEYEDDLQELELEEEQTQELLEASSNIGSISFTTTDLRTSQTISFKGNAGKVQMIIFGGISSCGNTNSVLDTLNGMVKSVSASSMNIYVFDIVGNSTSDILAETGNLNSMIRVANYNANAATLRQTCAGAVGLGSRFTMPFIVYVDASGNVYDSSTGYVDADKIASSLKSGGINITVGAMQTLYVTQYASYSYAYQILNIVNEKRAEQGLSALQMDKELLEAAMQRAAECSVYYSHTRPNGTSCYTASSKMNRENIAAGYVSPEDVMSGWLNSSGHYAKPFQYGNQHIHIHMEHGARMTQTTGMNVQTLLPVQTGRAA